MATYVLVHGAWHGAWCWHHIVARLQRASHRVMAPDLLSLGIDGTPPGSVTLRGWTDQIVALAESANEPIVLVGHSRGGIVLSEVAERIPERIRVLVYVTAFLLEDGRSLVDSVADQPESLVPPAMIVADDHQSATLRDDAIREAFYGRCSDDDVALARSLLKAEPLAPLAEAIGHLVMRDLRVACATHPDRQQIAHVAGRQVVVSCNLHRSLRQTSMKRA